MLFSNKRNKNKKHVKIYHKNNTNFPLNAFISGKKMIYLPPVTIDSILDSELRNRIRKTVPNRSVIGLVILLVIDLLSLKNQR